MKILFSQSWCRMVFSVWSGYWSSKFRRTGIFCSSFSQPYLFLSWLLEVEHFQTLSLSSNKHRKHRKFLPFCFLLVEVLFDLHILRMVTVPNQHSAPWYPYAVALITLHSYVLRVTGFVGSGSEHNNESIIQVCSTLSCKSEHHFHWFYHLVELKFSTCRQNKT